MSDHMNLDTSAITEACETIIANDIKYTPWIFEDQFIDEVIPLLVRPWDVGNLTRYRDYVVELTNPLRVISRTREPVVLYTVPAMYPRPTTSSTGEPGDASVANLSDHIAQQSIRSPFSMDHLMTDFLNKISITDSVENTVLKPLAIILAKHGRALEDDNHQPLYTLDGSALPASNVQSTVTESETGSFSDEYED